MTVISLRTMVMAALAMSLVVEAADKHPERPGAANVEKRINLAPKLETSGGEGGSNKDNVGKGDQDKTGDGEKNIGRKNVKGGRNNGGKEPEKPSPSGQPNNRRSIKSKPKENMTPFEIALDICPKGLFGCPIAEPGSLSGLPTTLPAWIAQGFECVNLNVDLNACGGCPSLDTYHDCTRIPGASAVACEAGSCAVQSCTSAYTLDVDGSRCLLK